MPLQEVAAVAVKVAAEAAEVAAMLPSPRITETWLSCTVTIVASPS
jgi:hypothetical protein